VIFAFWYAGLFGDLDASRTANVFQRNTQRFIVDLYDANGFVSLICALV
jgi:hypothetical protein